MEKGEKGQSVTVVASREVIQRMRFKKKKNLRKNEGLDTSMSRKVTLKTRLPEDPISCFFQALAVLFTDLSFWLLLYWRRRDWEVHSYF